MISVSKIGSDHIGANKNNQDFYFTSEDGKIKIVMDGCGSGDFSEIGTRLFHMALKEKQNINADNFEEVVKEIFSKVKEAVSIIYTDVTSVLYNMNTFTILAVFEQEDSFTVLTCGDGYIITQNKDGLILFNETKEVIEKDGEEYPKYFIYNYVDKSKLQFYKEEVTFTKHIYSKEEYANVGVATDGLRFWKKLNPSDAQKFLELLRKGKKGPLSRFITRCNEKCIEENGEIKKQIPVFQDDISIAF